MYVRVCMYMYCMYVWTHVYTNVMVHVYMFVCMEVCKGVHLCVSMCPCLFYSICGICLHTFLWDFTHNSCRQLSRSSVAKLLSPFQAQHQPQPYHWVNDTITSPYGQTWQTQRWGGGVSLRQYLHLEGGGYQGWRGKTGTRRGRGERWALAKIIIKPLWALAVGGTELALPAVTLRHRLLNACRSKRWWWILSQG